MPPQKRHRVADEASRKPITRAASPKLAHSHNGTFARKNPSRKLQRVTDEAHTAVASEKRQRLFPPVSKSKAQAGDPNQFTNSMSGPN
jgi:hypothetical protein